MITLILIGLLRGIRTHRTLVLENLALRLSRLETSSALVSCRGELELRRATQLGKESHDGKHPFSL
jgi:hypothetical protein